MSCSPEHATVLTLLVSGVYGQTKRREENGKRKEEVF